MPLWLMKSEPDVFSITDLATQGQARWDGVRNFQARNFLRHMRKDDLFLFYHSSCAVPGVAGIGRIVGEAYPDPTALEPDSPYHDARSRPDDNRWSAVDVAFVEAFAHPVTLASLKHCPALAELPLVQRGSRLSVMPVTLQQWEAILDLARAN